MAPGGTSGLVNALGQSVLLILGASVAKEGCLLAWLTLLGGWHSLVKEGGLVHLSISLIIKLFNAINHFGQVMVQVQVHIKGQFEPGS